MEGIESNDSDPDFTPENLELKLYEKENRKKRASIAPSTRSTHPNIKTAPSFQLKVWVKDAKSSADDLLLITQVLAEEMDVERDIVQITQTEITNGSVTAVDIDLIDLSQDQVKRIQELFVSYTQTCHALNQRLQILRPSQPMSITWLENQGPGDDGDEDFVPEQKDYKNFIKALSSGLDIRQDAEEEDEPWEPTEDLLGLAEETLMDNKDKINDNLMRELQKDARDDGNYTIDMTDAQERQLRGQLQKHFRVLLEAHYDLKALDRSNLPTKEREIFDESCLRIRKLLVELASARNGAKKSLCKTLYKRQVNFGTFSSDQPWTRSQPEQMKEEDPEVPSFFDVPGLKEFSMFDTEGKTKKEFEELFDEDFESITRTKPEESDGWTDSEDRLLALAVKLMGFGDRRLPRTHVINWKEIQARFLPHRSIKDIQKKHARLKKNRRSFFVGRIRAKARKMNAKDMHKLAQAVAKKGHKWAEISKEYLPHWNRDELRKRYFRNILPKREKHKKKLEEKKKQEASMGVKSEEPPHTPVKFFNPSMDWIKDTKWQLPSPKDLLDYYKEQQEKMDVEDSDSDFEPLQASYLDTLDDEIPALPNPDSLPSLPTPI